MNIYARNMSLDDFSHILCYPLSPLAHRSIPISSYLHHNDVLHTLDGRQAMRDDDYGPTSTHEVQSLLNDCYYD